MREKNIENKIKKYLTNKNWYHFKHHGGKFSRVGVPDIIACVNSIFVGIETKSSVGTTKPLQDLNIEQIRQSGGVAMVIKPENYEDFVKQITEVEKWQITKK